MTGSQIARYEVLDEIGHGAMGIVYRAYDKRLDRTIALKVLPPANTFNPLVRRRFENEARAASALDHPNICTIHEIGETEDSRLFIAMAYYAGRTLDKILEDGQINVEDALTYAVQLADGLHAAHDAGIIHRDVKPANVIVTEDGRLKILDFGLAKMEDVKLTVDGRTLGTVAYMSPEQARGETLQATTDQWSFGVVMYQLLTGRLPFNGEYSQAVLYSILSQDPEPIGPRVPREVANVVYRCIEKDPSARYPSMKDVAADLRLLLGGPRHRSTVLGSIRSTMVIAAVAIIATILVLSTLSPVRKAILELTGLTGLPSEKHLAVMRAPAVGEQPEDAAFADGIVQFVVASLQEIESREEDLWVVPTERVQAFAVDGVADAYRSLGVNLVVMVDVERSKGQTGVKLDLFDAAQERDLRSTRVVEQSVDLSRLSGAVVVALADLLDVELTAQTHRAVTAGQSASPGAYEFYTEGLGYLQRYREGRNLDAAILLFKNAMDSDSSYALAFTGLCEAYWRKFEDTEDPAWASDAEQSCERALELDPMLGTTYVTMGHLHTKTGRYATAINEYRLALERDSVNVRAMAGLAEAYRALGRLEEAERAYLKAIAAQPNYWGGYNDLGVFYYNLSRYEEAIDQFRRVAELNPFNVRAYSSMGAIYFYLERRDDAIRMFERGLEIQEDRQLYSNLGTLYYYEADYAKAAEAFEAAIRLGESAYKTWGYLATSYEWSGRPADARHSHEQALSLAEKWLDVNPREVEVLAHIATYHAYLDNREACLATLDRAIMESPTDPQDMSRIGEAYEVIREREQAIAWLEKALEAGYAVAEIRDYPGFADLRADPRFQSILARFDDATDR